MDYKTLNEIATNFRYGKMPDKSKLTATGNYPVWSGYRYVGYYDEKNVNKDEIVVVARGVGGTGDVKICKEDCFLTNLSIAFNVNEDINPLYVYYYYQIKNLRYLDSGSAQSQITINDLKNVRIPIPSKTIQDKIVEVLNKLDQKIELNSEINNNLLELSIEKIQNTNFDSYENLSNLSEVISKGTTPTTGDMKQFEDRNVKFIKVRDFAEYYINKKELEYIPKEIHEGKLKRSILKENDLLISIAGTLGKVAYVDNELDDSNTNQAVAFIRLKDVLNMGYLYFYLQTKKVQMEINEKQVHAVQPNFSLGMLGQIEAPILTDDEKKEYNDILNVIKNNIHQNEKLEQLRDTLLPKLMNGEIDLNNIEI